jgi:hypothetical protein
VISKVEALQNDLREGNFRLAMLHDLEERVQVLLSVETLHDGPALLTLDIEGRPNLEGIPVPYDLD